MYELSGGLINLPTKEGHLATDVEYLDYGTNENPLKLEPVKLWFENNCYLPIATQCAYSDTSLLVGSLTINGQFNGTVEFVDSFWSRQMKGWRAPTKKTLSLCNGVGWNSQHKLLFC